MQSRRPAVRLAILLVFGIILGQSVPLIGKWAYYLTSALYILALRSFLLRKKGSWSTTALQICVVSLGFTLHQYQRERVQEKIIEPAGYEEPMSVLGVVESDMIPQGEYDRFLLKSSFVNREGRLSPLERRFLVFAKRSITTPFRDSLELGSLIAFDGILRSMPHARNPGEFDYGKYLELNDIHGVLAIESAATLKIVNTGSLSLQKIISRLQKHLYSVLDRFHTSDQSSFIKGVALGYREDISLEMKQSFVDTGTIHILAVSGSNVAVVALMFYSFFGFFRLPKRTLTSVTIVGLLLYMVITGMSPSVMRATIMAIVILVGMAIERKTDIYNSICVAAVILLLWNTNHLFDVGFQLSFAAVVSIVYFYPILSQLIDRVPDWLEEIKGVDFVLKLFAVSLAAQLGTLPFSAYYFGKISLISLLANLVVVPISGVNTILGFTVIVSSFVSDFLSQCYAAVNSVLVEFLLGFVKAAAAVPLAYIETSNMSLVSAMFYFAGVAAVFNMERKSIVKGIVAFSMLAANLLVYSQVFANGSRNLRLTMLDVGQGDAILVEFPNRKNMLIDVGPKSLSYDAGESIVVPYLKRKGIRSVDIVLISHPHVDHFGGAAALLKALEVQQVVEGTSSADSGLYGQWRAIAEDKKVPRLNQMLGMHISIDPAARVYVLHPYLKRDSSSNGNNNSLVLKMMYGKTSALLTGDAELETEETLSHRFHGFISSQVLKAGHHGSITSSGEQLLKAVSPQISLISVGVKNKFRHPSEEVIQRLKSIQSDVFRTDRQGAIVLESDGFRWKTIDWR